MEVAQGLVSTLLSVLERTCMFKSFALFALRLGSNPELRIGRNDRVLRLSARLKTHRSDDPNATSSREGERDKAWDDINKVCVL